MKRFVIGCLAAILAAGLLLIPVGGFSAEEDGTTISSLLEKMPLYNVPYNYKNGSDVISASVNYSPALLMGDARQFSGELAKVSVALATAAYERSYVNSLLTQLGFTVYDNAMAYNRCNYLTVQDNDYVAYTVAYQELVHPVSGEAYRIYCVPIRGTPESAEWFSDFNLGTGTEHEGFKNASSEVYKVLTAYFSKDELDADHRIVWLTGHSRGAACANLLSGWLSRSGESYTKAEHVFGYTYACPAVSLNADTTLTNVYNFNNAGDMIPMLPMAEWGYDRYGQSITLDASALQLDNVKQQFQRVTGSTYAAEVNEINYHTLLVNIVGTDREVYYDSANLQAVLALAGWALGGKNDADLCEVLGLYMDVPEVLLENVVASLNTAWQFLTNASNDNEELSDWAYEAYMDTLGMSDEEFGSYLQSNAGRVSRLEEKTGIEIVDAGGFLAARAALQIRSSKISTASGCISAAMALVTDPDGGVMDKIAHGHTQATYAVWINSMYYGDYGWYRNPAVRVVRPAGHCVSIGQYAFSGCSGLTDVTIPESVTYIGRGAFFDCAGLTQLTLPDTAVALGELTFADCPGLRTVTLPVDCDLSNKPFGEYGWGDTNGVTTIFYTPGRTGVMPDRSATDYETLEGFSRGSLQSITFAEGVTHIGSYLMANGGSSLETVKLPATLKTIGQSAFCRCSALTDVVFPDGLTGIGRAAFSSCTALTQITIPDSVTVIPKSAFYNCQGMEKLVLPDTLQSIGNLAFANCPGLRTVTLPVDCDLSDKPFGEYGWSGTNGVTTIFYTPGRTGVMPDRLSTDSETLEGFSRGSIQSITFAEGVTHIGSYLMQNGGSALETVKLPSTLQAVGRNAFYSCSALQTVFYTGTQAQWDGIYFGKNNQNLLNAARSYTAIAQQANGVLLLTRNGRQDTLTVDAGQLLDLNGHVLTVDALVSFGQIIDSVGSGGLIAENIEITSNDWLPIQDSTGCYRFYEYEIESLGSKANDQTITFGFTLEFVDTAAYSALMKTADAQLTVTLSWRENTKTVAFSAAAIQQYRKLQREYPDLRPAMLLNVTGLDSLEDGETLTVTPSVTAMSGKLQTTGTAMTYTA